MSPDACFGSVAVFMLTPLTKVVFVSREQASRVLSTADDFSRRLSAFDRSVRLKSWMAVSPEKYLEFAGRCALDWAPGEVASVRDALDDIREGLVSYAGHFPAEILLVKTTGAEEFGCAYTRQNAVVMPPGRLSRPRDRLARLLAHELFHILSRHRPALRDSLYAALGFRPCEGLELSSVFQDTLANPDTPAVNYHICLTREGEPVRCVPVFTFRGGRCDVKPGDAILQYLEVRFLVVCDDGGCWKPAEKNGQPVLLDRSEVAGFYEQVGRNTGYDICAEELLAENFALLVAGKKEVPSPEVLETLDTLLSEGLLN